MAALLSLSLSLCTVVWKWESKDERNLRNNSIRALAVPMRLAYPTCSSADSESRGARCASFDAISRRTGRDARERERERERYSAFSLFRIPSKQTLLFMGSYRITTNEFHRHVLLRLITVRRVAADETATFVGLLDAEIRRAAGRRWKTLRGRRVECHGTDDVGKSNYLPSSRRDRSRVVILYVIRARESLMMFTFLSFVRSRNNNRNFTDNFSLYVSKDVSYTPRIALSISAENLAENLAYSTTSLGDKDVYFRYLDLRDKKSKRVSFKAQ